MVPGYARKAPIGFAFGASEYKRFSCDLELQLLNGTGPRCDGKDRPSCDVRTSAISKRDHPQSASTIDLTSKFAIATLRISILI